MRNPIAYCPHVLNIHTTLYSSAPSKVCENMK